MPGQHPTPAASLAEALRLHEAGRLAEAEQRYLALLRAGPNPDALHFLGLLNHQLGRHEVALDLMLQAQSRAAPSAFKCLHLGQVYQALGRHDAALAALDRALALDPTLVEAHGHRGVVLQSLGRRTDAAAAYRRVLDAVPDSVDARVALATVELELGQPVAAADRLRGALALAPERPDVHFNLGLALMALGDAAGAAKHFRRAAKIEPRRAQSWSQLGQALAAINEKAAALAAYDRAVALAPDEPVALHGKGWLLKEAGKPLQAIDLLRRLLEHNPQDQKAWANLCVARLEAGEAQAALECCEEGLRHWPDEPMLGSARLFAYGYLDVARDVVFEAHRAYGERLQNAVAQLHLHPQPHRGSTRRLRIGYVSPDFYRHPVGYLIAPVLRQHDRRRFEIHCYSDVTQPDDLTRRLQAQVDVWREVSRLDHAQVATLVVRDEIDILVDLTGHTGHNRLPVFAARPAPIQVTWLGYFDTTGLTTIDYILVDDYSVRDTAQRFTEKPWRLPDARFCFEPPEFAPEPASRGPDLGSLLTFGCFNNVAKVNDHVVELWANLLRNVPDSRLVLKSKAYADERVCERMRARFEARDVAPGRLELRPGSPHRAMLEQYADIDIALDPFPYTGGMTTLEALWMGVPVVTLKGDSIIGRQSAGILHLMDLDDCVATSAREYIEIATRLAADGERRAQMRKALREWLRLSPVCDAVRFTANLESAYQEMRAGLG